MLADIALFNSPTTIHNLRVTVFDRFITQKLCDEAAGKDLLLLKFSSDEL